MLEKKTTAKKIISLLSCPPTMYGPAQLRDFFWHYLQAGFMLLLLLHTSFLVKENKIKYVVHCTDMYIIIEKCRTFNVVFKNVVTSCSSQDFNLV